MGFGTSGAAPDPGGARGRIRTDNACVTFLTPIAGILAASIATPILLLFYFLKLRRRPVRVSSTLLWERAVRDLQVNAPFRWLRASWLLLLELLALWAFALALARPAIDATGPPAGRAVILIDTSASMSAPDGGDGHSSRLEEAKDRARDLINRLDEAIIGSSDKVEIAVASFASAPTALTGFTSGRDALGRAIGSIEATDQPADLASALKLAQALVIQGRSETERSTRVVLIGDGAYSEDALAIGLGGAEFRFIRVGPDPATPWDNLGIVALSARRDLNDSSLVRLFVRVVNAGPKPIVAPITLRLDDAPIETRPLHLPGASDKGVGQAVLTLQLTDSPTGRAKIASVWIERDDDLSADNAAAVRLDPVIPPRVLIVSPPALDEPRLLARRLLVGAVGAIGSTIIDTIDTVAYDGLAAAPDALERYDLVIFDGGAISWLPVVPTIRFGTRLTPRGRAGVNAGAPPATATIPGPMRFSSWRRSSPILREVNLDSVVIASAIPIERADDQMGQVTTEELASGPQGALITLTHDHGVDRLAVGFELAQSNWPISVSFVVFMTNAVEQLTRLIGEAAGVAFTTTDPIVVRPERGAKIIRAIGPEEVEKEVQPGASTVNLGALDRVGVYHIEGAVAADRLAPINLLDARESAIATADVVRAAGESARSGSLSGVAPREVWSWFALAGLIFLTIEWVLYAWRMRV